MTQSRANLWRYPPGAGQAPPRPDPGEEVFVVLDGTLTVDLGEPPERHEVPRGGVLVVRPGRSSSSANTGDEELVLFIYGAPPETGQAEFFDDVSLARNLDRQTPTGRRPPAAARRSRRQPT